jgi:hypothetical protein
VWGTLDDLKGKIGLPVSDTSRDDALTLVLEGASAKVAELARFSEANETGRVDLFENIQVGTKIVLERRPVDVSQNAVVVEGRYLAATEAWSALSFDLLDADKGELLVLGRDAWWPPTLVLRPPFMQWRNVTWPQVRVTYDVTGQGSDSSAPQELQDVTVALARYWYDRDLAGAATSEQIGVLTREYSTEAVPAWVLSRLAKHRKERASWV